MGLIIIRGLPGSGKSTLAYALYRSDNSFVCGADWIEADQFMTKTLERDMSGNVKNYFYNPALVKDCHRRCFEATEESLRKCGAAIVSNTFTRRWEYQPYINLAKKYNVPVQVIEVHGNFGSIHNVPEKIMQDMRSRWEPHNI